MKMLKRRLVRLEARLPPPSPELLLRLQHTAPLFERWDRLGAAAFAFGGYGIGVANNLPYVVGWATLPWVLWAS